MKYDHILVRYGELSLKGKNRGRFVDSLVNNVKRKCQSFKSLAYKKTHGRLYIILNGVDYQEVFKKLDEVFGIHSYSLARRCDNDINSIKELALEVVKDSNLANKRFKVETKRGNKQFPLTSLEVSKEVAGYVLSNEKGIIVDVRSPEFTLNIDIQSTGTYITEKAIRGLGGFPAGISGDGLLLLSGGIDSPVAGFLTQKRGVHLHAVHFASPPYTSEDAKLKVLDLGKKLCRYQKNGKLIVHVVNFTDIQNAIYHNLDKSYLITIMRRMMFRITEEIANKNDIKLLITGESIGQVASQTLDSMYCVNNVTTLPITRPLASLDKIEIIDIARKIDTYETSILPFEDCCTIFVPKNPVTHPKLDKCLELEEKLDIEDYIQKAMETIEKITLDLNNNTVTEQNSNENSELIDGLF